jgi:hypothetical protein
VQSVVLPDLLEQHVLRVLVGNVADHQGGPSVSQNLTLTCFTLSAMMRYSWAYYPDTVLLFLCDICRW